MSLMLSATIKLIIVSVSILNLSYADCYNQAQYQAHYTPCGYDECHFAECHGA
jgi:hypothetical protein